MASIIATVLIVVRWLVPLSAGLVIGALAVLLYEQKSEQLNTWMLSAVGAGIAFSIVLFLIFQGARVVIRARVADSLSNSFAPLLGEIVSKLTGRRLTEDEQVSLGVKSVGLAQAWVLAVSSLFFIGLTISLAGTLVTLGQTFAAYQQVARLDVQNALTTEAGEASKIASTKAAYAIHQGLVLDAIDAHEKARKNDENEDVSAALLKVKVSAALATALPYAAHPSTPIAARFSPEKAQLFVLLLSAGVRELGDFSFDAADFSGHLLQYIPPDDLVDVDEAELGMLSKGARMEAFDEIEISSPTLRGAMLQNARLGSIDLSTADLSGSYLPPAIAIRPFGRLALNDVPSRFTRSDGYPTKQGPSANDEFFGLALSEEIERFPPGANFEGARVSGPDWLMQVSNRIGGDRIEFSLWKAIKSGNSAEWSLTLDTESRRVLEVLRDFPLPFFAGCAELVSKENDSVQAIVAAINGQRLDSWRQVSREKGLVVFFSKPGLAECLAERGADLRNAFLGFKDSKRKLVLGKVDLSSASFRDGQVSSIDARGAVLPEAEQFFGFTVNDSTDALDFEGALVPSINWLTDLEIKLLVRTGNKEESSFGTLSCSSDHQTWNVCKKFQEYRLTPASDGNRTLFRVDRTKGQ